ncbi:unnamed protein product [Schistosoma haematobium]|nr:unnamed protein product [Schistosoma haematobium]
MLTQTNIDLGNLSFSNTVETKIEIFFPSKLGLKKNAVVVFEQLTELNSRLYIHNVHVYLDLKTRYGST